MKEHPVCQSCAAPLSEENVGSNRDRSPSKDYCQNCYKNGEFQDQSLSLHCLEVKLMEMAEVHNEISLEEAQHVIKLLPTLKRWKMNNL